MMNLIFDIDSDINVALDCLSNPECAAKFSRVVNTQNKNQIILHDTLDPNDIDKEASQVCFRVQKTTEDPLGQRQVSYDYYFPDDLIGQRLINFLTCFREPQFGFTQKTTGRYCCIDFVNEIIFGRENITRNGLSPQLWENLTLDFDGLDYNPRVMQIAQEDLNVNQHYDTNDIVILTDDHDYFRHIAYAIGGGLFLSVYGGLGPLLVTNLEQMMNYFSATKHFQAHPKNYFGTNPSILFSFEKCMREILCCVKARDSEEFPECYQLPGLGK